MYIAKIPGSRYILSLESDQSQWFLRLKLDNTIEAEVPVTHMTKRALHSNMGTLFQKVNLQVNSFQHDLLHKEIVSQIAHLLSTNDTQEGGTTPTSTEPHDDPRIGQLENKFKKLHDKVDTLEARIERLEQLSSE